MASGNNRNVRMSRTVETAADMAMSLLKVEPLAPGVILGWTVARLFPAAGPGEPLSRDAIMRADPQPSTMSVLHGRPTRPFPPPLPAAVERAIRRPAGADDRARDARSRL